MTLTKVLVTICFYCSKCTKFGQLILRKIIKIVAARCQILRPGKFDFAWGSAQDPAGKADSALPDPLAGFNGTTTKERKVEGGGGREGQGRGVQCVPYVSRCLLATLNFRHVTVGFGPIRFLRVFLDKKLK